MKLRSLPVETTTVYLPSKGLNERRATKHTYERSEIRTLPARGERGPVTGLVHLFKCSETGELRVYGFDVTFGTVN